MKADEISSRVRDTLLPLYLSAHHRPQMDVGFLLEARSKMIFATVCKTGAQIFADNFKTCGFTSAAIRIFNVSLLIWFVLLSMKLI